MHGTHTLDDQLAAYQDRDRRPAGLRRDPGARADRRRACVTPEPRGAAKGPAAPHGCGRALRARTGAGPAAPRPVPRRPAPSRHVREPDAAYKGYTRAGHASATSARAASWAASAHSGRGSSVAAAIVPSTSTEICRPSRSGSAAPASRASSVSQARTARLCSAVGVRGGARLGLARGPGERAAAETVPLARRDQRVEDSDERSRGSAPAASAACRSAPRQCWSDLWEIGQDQIVLGTEVGVERRLRHARLGDASGPPRRRAPHGR
ncbi:hypothetical protein SANTM175S_03003 [Streptomyces antimycoticus]